MDFMLSPDGQQNDQPCFEQKTAKNSSFCSVQCHVCRILCHGYFCRMPSYVTRHSLAVRMPVLRAALRHPGILRSAYSKIG